MSRWDRPKIYRNHHPFRVAFRILLGFLIFLVVLFICIFVGFRKYIVYTPDGLYLDVPWLEDTTEEPTDESPFSSDDVSGTPVSDDATSTTSVSPDSSASVSSTNSANPTDSPTNSDAGGD